MEERIIEAEEYAPGRFREPRPNLRHWFRNFRRSQKPKERSSGTHWNNADTIIVNSCVSAFSIGLTVRIIVVIDYILSCRRVAYDMDISFLGLAAKFFWICLDLKILAVWMKKVQPKLPRSDSKIAVLIPLLVRSACWVVSGYVIHQVIVAQRLSFFFAVSKAMVMGSAAVIGLVIVHRIECLLREFIEQNS